ncbi:MAG: glycosyltransferase, partial [Acidimicrobiia bacterium]
GRFGSGGHQDENARFLASSGAAVVIDETDVAGLAEVIDDLLGDGERLAGMRMGASAIAKPRAALTIADAMIEAAK